MPTGSRTALRQGADLAGPLYCDSSALVKLYVPEPDSDQLNRALLGRQDLWASDLAVTEIVSSVVRRRREGLLNTEQANRIRRAIVADLESGLIRRVDLTRDTHREAEQLLLLLATPPLRAADALHLALAVAAGIATLLTYDRRLRDAAVATGIDVFPSAL